MKKNFLLTLFVALATLTATAQSPCTATISYVIGSNGAVTLTATPATANSAQTFTWSYGNGTSGFGNPVTVNYSSNGAFTACVTVHDSSSNCNYTTCDSVVVSNVTSTSPCSANMNYTINANGNVTFYATAANATSNLQYSWNYGNGTSGSGNQTSCNFTANGTYTVCLTSTDTTAFPACTSTTCSTISISNITPACSASYYIVPDSMNATP